LYKKPPLSGYKKLKNFKKILEKLRNFEIFRRDLENRAGFLLVSWGGTLERGLFLLFLEKFFTFRKNSKLF
jgi:hypothetical protein